MAHRYFIVGFGTLKLAFSTLLETQDSIRLYSSYFAVHLLEKNISEMLAKVTTKSLVHCYNWGSGLETSHVSNIYVCPGSPCRIHITMHMAELLQLEHAIYLSLIHI